MSIVSTAYLFCKDMFLYMNNKSKYVKTLRDNLTGVVAKLGTYYEMKKKVDIALEKKKSKEISKEYMIVEVQIEGYVGRCKEILKKYKKYWPNLPELELTVPESVKNLIVIVENNKPTIKTINFFKLAKLSQKTKELHDLIPPVIKRMEKENMLRDKAVEPVQIQYGDIDVPSSAQHVEKILRFLQDEKNRSIGILGLSGVGKTNVMKMLNNHEYTKHHFDIVIWINYNNNKGTNDNTIEVQHKIMRRLELEDLKEASCIEDNANRISTALCDKKYMLLFDQVTSDFKLNEVGIHQDHKFGKVVVASSSKKIIHSMTIKHVEIKRLSKEDAMNLFKRVCGEIYDSRNQDIAEGIVESCLGWPALIKLVANHLKYENDNEVWCSVKTKLQSDTMYETDGLKLIFVENAFKLAYDKLQDRQKKCLLFVTLFPSDHIIHKDNLVECWKAEGLLGVPNYIRNERQDGAIMLKELADEYLLENYSESDKHVKMQVHFRKLAILQEFPGEKNSLCWQPDKKKNIQELKDETWSKAKWLSLIGCETTLPICPKCENISTLLMQNLRIQSNPNFVELGDKLFDNMNNLRILDLSETRIKSLPKSTYNLVSLVCLYLNGCLLLTNLPNKVSNMKILALLDIRGTSIHSLPIEVGHMTNLQCLRISFSQKSCNRYGNSKVITKIPYGIINHLKQLEELCIEVGCCNQAWDDIVDNIANDIATLEKLSTLDFHFQRVSSLHLFVTNSKSIKKKDTNRGTTTFRSFNISIGCYKMQHPYGLNIPGILADRKLRLSTQEDICSVGEIPTQEEWYNEDISSFAEVPTLAKMHNEENSSVGVAQTHTGKNDEKISSDGEVSAHEKRHLGNNTDLSSVGGVSIHNEVIPLVGEVPTLTESHNEEIFSNGEMLTQAKISNEDISFGEVPTKTERHNEDFFSNGTVLTLEKRHNEKIYSTGEVPTKAERQSDKFSSPGEVLSHAECLSQVVSHNEDISLIGKVSNQKKRHVKEIYSIGEFRTQEERHHEDISLAGELATRNEMYNYDLSAVGEMPTQTKRHNEEISSFGNAPTQAERLNEEISSVEEVTQEERHNNEISLVGESLNHAEMHNKEISSIVEVLYEASSFELFNNGVGNLSMFSLENVGSLKVCVVGMCKNMKSIVNASNTNIVLKCLEKLHLFDLILLERIWKGRVSSGSLANLKVLTLSGCPEIITILNYELAKALSSLECVNVKDCIKVEEIIGEDITNGENLSGEFDRFDFLNKVTTIELVNLPNLRTLCTGTTLKLRSLVTIKFEKCNVAFDSSNAEKIKDKIKCESRWWEEVFNKPLKEEDICTEATHEAGHPSNQGGSLHYLNCCFPSERVIDRTNSS